MDELQLEELKKSNQQAQNHSQHDPNAADRFPDGYTPVGEVTINTPVERVDLSPIGELQVTTLQKDLLDDIVPQDLYGSSSDNIVFGNTNDLEVENTKVNSTTPIRNLNYVPNDLPDTNIFSNSNSGNSGLPDSEEQEQIVDTPVPPVDPLVPLVDPPVDPEDPEDPPVDPEDPEDPPVDPEDPEDPPVDPEDPNSGNQNNGFGNGDQDAPGGSGPNNNAENDQTPGEQGNSHQNDNGNGGNSTNHQNNGWGNGDDNAPGNSGSHNNAENDQTPSGSYDDFVGRFLEENSVDHSQITHNWEQDNTFLDYDDQHIDLHYDIPEMPYVDHFDHSMDHFDHPM